MEQKEAALRDPPWMRVGEAGCRDVFECVDTEGLFAAVDEGLEKIPCLFSRDIKLVNDQIRILIIKSKSNFSNQQNFVACNHLIFNQGNHIHQAWVNHTHHHCPAPHKKSQPLAS